jgi:hypothetical protein
MKLFKMVTATDRWGFLVEWVSPGTYFDFRDRMMPSEGTIGVGIDVVSDEIRDEVLWIRKNSRDG